MCSEDTLDFFSILPYNKEYHSRISYQDSDYHPVETLFSDHKEIIKRL